MLSGLPSPESAVVFRTGLSSPISDEVTTTFEVTPKPVDVLSSSEEKKLTSYETITTRVKGCGTVIVEVKDGTDLEYISSRCNAFACFG